jgi:hypothetical protein
MERNAPSGGSLHQSYAFVGATARAAPGGSTPRRSLGDRDIAVARHAAVLVSDDAFPTAVTFHAVVRKLPRGRRRPAFRHGARMSSARALSRRALRKRPRLMPSPWRSPGAHDRERRGGSKRWFDKPEVAGSSPARPIRDFALRAGLRRIPRVEGPIHGPIVEPGGPCQRCRTPTATPTSTTETAIYQEP